MGYDRVLVPTDGSEIAENALEHASSIAQKYDAQLHSIYVVDTGVDTEKEKVSELMNRLQESGELESTGKKALKNAEQITGVKIQKEILTGKPHKEIKKYVQDNQIDLVVMGTHGRSGLDRMLLGSVTEKVLRSLKVPVMTVPEKNS